MPILIDWCHGVLVLPPEFFFWARYASLGNPEQRGWHRSMDRADLPCQVPVPLFLVHRWCRVQRNWLPPSKLNRYSSLWTYSRSKGVPSYTKSYHLSGQVVLNLVVEATSLSLRGIHRLFSFMCKTQCNHMVSGETNLFYFRHFLFHPTGMTTEEQIFGMVCNHQPLGGSTEKPEAFAYPILLWLNCCPDFVS